MTPLRRLLRKRGGRMAWRDWMEAALHDVESGYYTATVRTVGRGGDFSTSATLSDGLGRAVAAWVRREWREAGRKLPLIEIGPGDGSLHETVRGALGWLGRWGLRSHLVERSPGLRREQEKRLGFGRVRWHGTMEEALAACGGEALIFSNELADAFPATLLQREGGEWREVWLEELESGAIAEVLEPMPEGVESAVLGGDWPEGQRVEVLTSWREWLRGWVPGWRGGAMLTVDYGGSGEEIYGRRPGGTVRGYWRHERLGAGALYGLTGKCDVTVDVNFDDLERWGEEAGLVTVFRCGQGEFVRAVVPGDPLSVEGGAGEAFVCLGQRRVRPS